MSTSHHLRAFTNAEVNALHAAAFEHRVFDDV
jgi:hypothetical protein